MRAIVIEQYGGPEQLRIQEIADPFPQTGRVIVQVKAFGISRADVSFRKGAWGEVAKVSGIECIGIVKDDPSGEFEIGQKVAALAGGMGRTFNGSYAEYTSAPISNVVPIDSELSWEELAALPESYATAWTCLRGNLSLTSGQTLLVRGGTSALGQASVNIANHLGASVFATTRNQERATKLKEIGADEVLIDDVDLHRTVRAATPYGIDAVLDLVGNATLRDSLKMVHRDGRVCLAGFLGDAAPIPAFNPLAQMPSGVQFSFFAGEFTFGSREYPLSEIPFQQFADLAAEGTYRAKPSRVFRFEDIQEAHRVMEANQANGKLVVRV